MDFLLMGKIQKRNTRPLTVTELMHRDREISVSKLEYEIRNLQKMKDYEQGLKTTINENKFAALEKNSLLPVEIAPAGKLVGPMIQALKDLRRRLKGSD
jgi:hypothetical protein